MSSTINPTLPANGVPYTPSVIRNNFANAYHDVNEILQKYGSPTAPNSPTQFQDWVDVSELPYIWKIYDGSEWCDFVTIDPDTHTITISSSVEGVIAVVNGGTGSSTTTGWQNNLYYKLAAIGAVARTAASKLSDMVSVKDFGAVGDGITDDATAINNALAASLRVYFPAGTYLVGSQLIMQIGQMIDGESRSATTIKKGFNGDLFSEFKDSASFSNITLDGNGANFTGRLLPVLNTSGSQSAYDFAFVNSDGEALYFENAAGSQSCFINGKIARYNGTSSDAYCSVVIEDASQTSAKPRKFIGIETNGTYFINFGGSNNTYVIGCFSGGYKFSANSRAVFIESSRWANQASCSILGDQISIIGGDVYPSLTLDGIGPYVIGPFNQEGNITNNSQQNVITTPVRSYTPIWTASSTNPSIGSGTLRGNFSNSGSIVKFAINVVMASDTTYGSGVFRFSLPQMPLSPNNVNIRCHTWLTHSSGSTSQVASARIIPGTSYVVIDIAGGTSQVNATAPWTWDANDTINISGEYFSGNN